MIKRVKNSLYSIFIIISAILVVMEASISRVFSIIDYYDEMFSIIIFVMFLCDLHGKINKNIFKIILTLCLLIIIGTFGNLMTDINLNAFIMGVDALGVIKVFISLISIKELTNRTTKKAIVSALSFFISIFILICFLFYFVTYSGGNSEFFAEARFGIKSYSFIMTNPGELGYLLMGMFLLLTLDTKKRLLVKMMTLFLILTTTKGPQVLFVLIFLFLKFFTGKKRINSIHLISITIITLIVGQYQIHNYLLNETSVRYILNLTSLQIAKDHFPIGSGLATFGDEMSRVYYSDIYYQYNLSSIWGISPVYSYFINDNYWAMILGQFGFIGCMLMIYVLYKTYYLIKSVKPLVNVEEKSAATALYFAFIIGSVGSAYLTSSSGLFCFMILGLYLAV